MNARGYTRQTMVEISGEDEPATPSRLELAAEQILNELADRYDGATDSTTLWMGEHITRLQALLNPTPTAAPGQYDDRDQT